MKHILVTGSGGFLGRRVVALARQHSVAVSATDLLSNATQDSDIDYRVDALRDVDSFTAWIQASKPSCIVHAAGSTRRDASPDAWQACIDANVVPLARIIHAVTSLPESDRPCIVVPGSQFEYGAAPMPWGETTLPRPTSAYGASKLAATELLSAAVSQGSVKGCTLRLPIVFGPAQAPSLFIPDLILHALRAEAFDMTEGRQERCFVYVDDAATMLLDVAERLTESGFPSVLNAPALGPHTMIEVARSVVDMVGTASQLNAGVLPYRADELMQAWPAAELAKEIGVRPSYTLHDALKETIDSYRETAQSGQ